MARPGTWLSTPEERDHGTRRERVTEGLPRPLHREGPLLRGGVHYDVPSSKIRKMLSWEIVLLREHGVVVEEVPDEDLQDRRKALAEHVLQLLDANPKLERHVRVFIGG